MSLIVLLEPKLSEIDHPVLHLANDVLVVTGSSVRVHKGQAHAVVPSWVMHGRLEPLDVDRQFLGSSANPLCCPPSPLSQKVSDSFPVGNLIQKGQNGGHVPPLEFNAIRIFNLKKAFFIAFHRKCDRRPAANGIHAISITYLVGFDYGREIVVQDQRSKGRAGLIFWTWSLLNAIGLLFHLDHALACDGTERTRMGPNQVVLCESGPAEFS